MVFCSLIASSAIRAFISALKLRRCLDFISAPFPRQRFYTLLTGPNSGEHFTFQSPPGRWILRSDEHLRDIGTSGARTCVDPLHDEIDVFSGYSSLIALQY